MILDLKLNATESNITCHSGYSHSTQHLPVFPILREPLWSFKCLWGLTGQLYSPSCDHELFLRGFLPDLGVDVHGEEGAGTVEDGGQRAHERGQHDRQHQASQSWEKRRL